MTFYEPVDIYQRNYRAVHYAVLLIAITFLTFFLWEHLAGIAIHGMQYLMVGLALALFYLLLLALSEHMTFDLAYGVLGRRAGGAHHDLPDRRAQARCAGARRRGGARDALHDALLDPALRGLLAAHGFAAAVRRARDPHDRHAPRRLVERRAAQTRRGGAA